VGGTELDGAWDALTEAIAASTSFVRQHPFFADDAHQVPAYRFLLAMLIARLEEHVVFDPHQPAFRVIDPRTREGGDNADQRYLSTRLVGGETYRIWGRVGSARRVEVQIYAGAPFVLGRGGRMASYLTFEQLDVDAAGNFEVIASPSPQPGTWLENPPDATAMLVRQVFSEWADADPGEVHIDRVGHEGDPLDVTDPGTMASRLGEAADELVERVTLWPEFVRRLYVDAAPPNTVSALMDPGRLGGVPDRWMAHGTWDLGPDEALVITTWPAPGNYQGIQLCDLWFSSLEYGSRQSSLTGDQARADNDGAYRFVVSAVDPGVDNWLDTTGLQRGVFLLRFDGTGGATIPADRQPRAQLARIADLASALPADTPTCSPARRAEQLAARRRHLQRRFNW
jgi:hypothetical protein